jgi:glycosyltransferase involved in cell wall biosynthesis
VTSITPTAARDRPLLSVLIPSYNAAAHVEACVRSVLGQSHDDFELVIVDDVSTDGTYEVLVGLAAGDERITLTRNATNLGNVANFRKLFGLARGKYLNFVCCDDLLLPQSFERKLALLEEHPDVTIAAGQRLVIDASGVPIQASNQYIWTHTPFTTQQGTYVVDGYAAGNSMLVDINNWIGEPSAAMFRNGLLAADDPYELGGVRPARNLDLVWWLRLMAGARLGYINEPLSCFRHREGQQSRQAALVPDLTLSWYDIVLGAKNAGYLASSDLEVRALARVAQHIESRLPQLVPNDLDRTMAVLTKIAQRIQELGAQRPMAA